MIRRGILYTLSQGPQGWTVYAGTNPVCTGFQTERDAWKWVRTR